MTVDTGGEEILAVPLFVAAEALEIHPSTVSRYLKLHKDLNIGTAARPRVNVEAMRAHRAENTERSKAGSHAGKLLGEAGENNAGAAGGLGEGGTATAPAATRKGAKTGDPSYAIAKAVHETVKAQGARIDLDVKRGLLVSRAPMEDKIYDTGQELQGELLALGAQLAERLAAMGEPRAIAALLESEHRQILANMASRLALDARKDAAA